MFLYVFLSISKKNPLKTMMWLSLLYCRVYYMSGPSHGNTSVPQILSIPIFQTPNINFVVFLTN